MKSYENMKFSMSYDVITRRKLNVGFVIGTDCENVRYFVSPFLYLKSKKKLSLQWDMRQAIEVFLDNVVKGWSYFSVEL